MDNFTNGTLDVAHLLACEEVTSKVVLQHQPLDLLQRRQRNVGNATSATQRRHHRDHKVLRRVAKDR